jgi:hypothetical protein
MRAVSGVLKRHLQGVTPYRFSNGEGEGPTENVQYTAPWRAYLPSRRGWQLEDCHGHLSSLSCSLPRTERESLHTRLFASGRVLPFKRVTR